MPQTSKTHTLHPSCEAAINVKDYSHAVIISGGTSGERRKYALSQAAYMLCTGRGDRPCGECRHCKKAYSGIHPDITIIARQLDEKGRQRRELYIHQIREMISDAYIKPNEADRKVYIILDAEALNLNAQNAMLKVLEEPPGGAAFILCAQTSDPLLPTVRSRCSENTLGGQEHEWKDGILALAREYVGLVYKNNPARLLRFCAGNEKMDSSDMAEFVQVCRELIAKSLTGEDCKRGDMRRLISIAELLDLAEAYLKRNVGVKHVFGILAAGVPCSAERKDRTVI